MHGRSGYQHPAIGAIGREGKRPIAQAGGGRGGQWGDSRAPFLVAQARWFGRRSVTGNCSEMTLRGGKACR